MNTVLIVGGGAAGMLSGMAAAKKGSTVHIFEKNEKLGKKVYITGKGRCNVTNACDTEELFGNVVTNAKFLYSSFYGFTNFNMMDLLEELGCPLKTERGNRVFPASDKSSDVIKALHQKLLELGVTIHYKKEVVDLLISDGKLTGLVIKEGEKKEHVMGDSVILASGGSSYPSTGSTGEGYKLAKTAGHTVTPLSPALVPFVVEEPVIRELQGLSLRNVSVTLGRGKKIIYEEFGEMLFTHYGVSGPVLLSASSYAAKELKKGPLSLTIDLKPALSEEQLDARILRDFEETMNKQFKNSINGLYPAKMVPVIIELSKISPEKKVNEITKEERHRIIDLTKRFPLTVTGLRGMNEAIITQGGVSVKEVNPSTMESKILSGLYFAGEILDLDAVTGGFNLQIAWSTGWAAGNAAGEEEHSKDEKGV
ncbi:NAD(P)/FAD-dependent oxidoreductase [Clostridium sp. E02]|uniref:NAD(P)/FAD-dependent oxidoreductase n=1 Tax=Clostridium sp. E02 TaxID=2487134 RepID=UPI000F544BE3|nr:NAD(P)/FAD-dependent oxidoreductase [Clostridium sp. E02]